MQIIGHHCHLLSSIHISDLLLVGVVTLIAFRSQVACMLVLLSGRFASLTIQTGGLNIMKTALSNAPLVKRSVLSAGLPARSRGHSFA